VVHRDDRVPEARDTSTVAERGSERLPECERRVLCRVVVTGLRGADALEHQVEPGVEGKLLEEVVVESRPGLDTNASLPVEREPRREARLRGRAERPHAPPARGGRAPECLEEAVVVLAVEHRDPE